MQRIYSFILAFLFVLAGTGCWAPVEQLPAEEIIARSSDHMIAMDGFEFLVDRSGSPVFVDGNQTVIFRQAKGRFAAPDRVHTTVRLISPGLVTDVQVLGIGPDLWVTNLLSGQWQASDPRYYFNPSRLFDPQIGIPALLKKDLTNVTLRGMEELPEIPGKSLYALEAALQGNGAYEMTYGLIDKDTLRVQVWIAPESFDLYRVILVDPADPDEDEDTVWQIDLWNFGEKFDIEAPSVSPE